MSLRSVHEFPVYAPSPAHAMPSMASRLGDPKRPHSELSPHVPYRDYVEHKGADIYSYPPPLPRLPPLRTFLEVEGIPRSCIKDQPSTRDNPPGAPAVGLASQSPSLEGQSYHRPSWSTRPATLPVAHRHDFSSLRSNTGSRTNYPSPSSIDSDNTSRKRKDPYSDDSDSDDFNNERDGNYVDTEDDTPTRTEELSINTSTAEGGARVAVGQRVSTLFVPKSKGNSKSKPPSREYYNALGVKLEVREVKVDFNPHEWPKHIVESETRGKWRCTWQTMRNGVPSTCQYIAKKHLVKRHIEATHMNIKRFECSWCFKTFTQKSNVAGCHLNTHSGEAPHECEYCDERFKDPSKKHKHMARFHSYGPRSKQPRLTTAVATQSAHETITPWNTSPSGGL